MHLEKIQDTFLKFLVDFFIKISYIQEIIFDDINNCMILTAHKLIYLLTCFESMWEFIPQKGQIFMKN